MSPSAERKKVAVFDPEERSGTLLGKLLEHLGYEVELHRTSKKVPRRTHGSKTVDLLIINLAVFGDTYQQVTEQMGKLQLNAKDAPPMIAVTTLRISQDARERLEQLGARAVFSQNAQLVELMFEVNRLLFPKIRELRRYTRVFGGFPVRFLQGGQWREGEVYNISQEGAFIQCKNPPEENSKLQVRFVLPGLDVSIEVQAHVNWVHKPAGDLDLLSPEGMGVNFLTLNQEESTSLDKFIAGRVNGNDLLPGSSSSSS
jgi:CheY-like chemotaxis protein